MNKDPIKPARLDDLPEVNSFQEAIGHVGKQVSLNEIAVGAAKGILYGLVEALGVIVGDPDLPSHIRSGYEGVLAEARELQIKIHQL
jgi:TRAP-type mannitol/chloroaromatic compound transport system permease large subunit